MNFKNHKDKLPQDTIKEIRNIIYDLGIFVYESRWYSVSSNCYSVSIKNRELECSTNGKGISREYSLASAYGEFMERLQTGFLINKDFGLMENDTFRYPDEIEMTLGSYAENNKSIVKNTLNPGIVEKYKDHKIRCFPAYDVIGEKPAYLTKFISMSCISNGLCAGNTPEEAICQGINEIFERFVVREIYFNKNIDFPTIPLSVLKELEIYCMIDMIIKKGYQLTVKDCTFNGRFPVVGVFLINKKTNSYLYRFGSDPIFEVALQRCITELFQGLDKTAIRDQFLRNELDFSLEDFKNEPFFTDTDDIKIYYRESLTYGNGKLPKNVFTSTNETTDFKKGFQDKFVSHTDSLNFLVNIIKKNNFNLYILDRSNLGFPAFRVFIPELAAVEKINDIKFKTFFIERSFIKRVLLGLKKASKEDINKCAVLLESLINMPELYHRCRDSFTCKFLLNLLVDKSSHIKQFDNLVYLVGMLYFRVSNYEKAFKYLNLYIKEEGSKLGNSEYYSCVLLYLKLKSGKVSDSDLFTISKNTYGEELAKEVIDDLSTPGDCFKYFTLPECGDCSACPIKKECHYELWSKVNKRIVDKIKNNPINQEDLAKVFLKN